MKKLIICMMIFAVGFSLCACSKEADLTESKKEKETEEVISEEAVDYSSYFEGLTGGAVIFDSANGKHYVYNEVICKKQVSPCSTFKIISTLMGLENAVLTTEDSIMGYDGSIYPIDEWNTELSLTDAFQKSCVWYFRKVIDEVGRDEAKRELENLGYGNCDISEWDGSGINPLDDLNGFWLESSLKISPIEQAMILADIFEGNTDYSEKNISILKDIMQVDADIDNRMKTYGKTGSGINGHAWFVGFIEENEQRYYFAVYIDDNSKDDISGNTAKEIAVNILEDFNEN